MILAEYGTAFNDDWLVQDFMDASDRAFKRQEDRSKAVQNGQVYHSR